MKYSAYLTFFRNKSIPVKSYISCLVFVFLFTACQEETAFTLPYFHTPDFTPYWYAQQSDVPDTLHQIGAFTMYDQNGQAINEKQFDGKISCVHFFFTSCGTICPKMIRNLKPLAMKYATNNKVQIVSISVTPWIDSVSRLQKYALKNQLLFPNWHLVTGNKSEIYSLARKQFFAEEETGFTKDSTEFLHTENVLLIDTHRRIRGIYHGTLPLDEKHLEEDIALLLKESSKN